MKNFAKRLTSSIALLTISLISLTSCRTIELRDQEWCGDKSHLGARCSHTYSNVVRDVPKAQWDRERVGMVCSRAENFAENMAIIKKLCSETKKCTRKQINALQNFTDDLDEYELEVRSLQ